MTKSLLLITITCFLLFKVTAQPGNDIFQKDLSKQPWKLNLDKDAPYWNDSLYLPPVNISILKPNAPTVGWDKIYNSGTDITLPATVEQYLWGFNGNRFGITGDYSGVSWFTTNMEIPASYKGKRVVLSFESVRMRAEIYVNDKLTGYDIIAGTPFEVDITDVVECGKTNKLAVRITDANGSYAWRDWETYFWGKYEIPPSHGFGGITGNVMVKATDKVYVSDVFVKNELAPTSILAQVTLANLAGKPVDGSIEINIKEWKTNKTILNKSVLVKIISSELTTNIPVTCKDANLWTPETPNLYILSIKWSGVDGSKHEVTKRFGFRSFEVKLVNGDMQYLLNGKKIVLRTAISWGYWPVNGLFPTPEMARKQIETAKAFGLNMLNFHRTIGQPIVLDYADELGLLYYEEPGGYKPGLKYFTREWDRIKLMRMITRDRSHPSLIIYNMINEAGQDPIPANYKDIREAHKLDFTRAITYSTNFFPGKFYGGKAPLDPAPCKMHMVPYDTTLRLQGWWDEHHADGPGVYKDQFYKSPTDYLRYSNHAGEIIFYGEEGAIGTIPRLELIKRELDASKQLGWDGDSYLKMYDAFNNFIDEKGFRKAFPTMEDFTKSFGNVAMYYQGRIIENVRINNVIDGYAVNGWESEKIENHSGIVDVFRNPKGDPSILSYYNQPLYVAVKARNKVFQLGDSTLTDFFLVNEKNVKGSLNLIVKASDEQGTFYNKTVSVKATGGDKYGELLYKEISIKPRNEGYTHITAELHKGNAVVANGKEELFVVDANPAVLKEKVAVVDTSGSIQKMLTSAGIDFKTYKSAGTVDEKCMIIGGDMQPGFTILFRFDVPIFDWVSRGNTLIILKKADTWAEYLMHKEVVDFRGKRDIRPNWYGGNYFVKEHPLFAGLPMNTAFNWEYQCLAGYELTRFGLRLKDEDCIVGLYADHKAEALTSVGVIPFGQGKIIISTLDLEGALKTKSPASAVARKLLINYVKFGEK